MGTLLYKYPGELIDDEPEINAADIEDNISNGKKGRRNIDDDSDFSWSENSEGSYNSFSSEKLIDGY